MDALIDLEIRLIALLQGMGQWLVPLMQGFSFLGTEQFYLLIAPAVYWCIDPGLGLRLGFFMMMSNSLNVCLKLLFHGSRPFWISSAVKGFEYEPSFGFPSGHSENAAVFYPALAAGLSSHYRKKSAGLLIWTAAISAVVLIGISRLFLGMHFLHDVLAGFFIGLLSLLIFMKLAGFAGRLILKQRFVMQIIILFVASVIIILAGILSLIITGISGFEFPAAWAAAAAAASPGKPEVNPFELSGIISGAAGFFGLGAGACFIKAKGGFSVSGATASLVLRYFIGMAGLLVLWSGLGMVFPRGEAIIPYLLRFFRYSLAGFWVTGLAPFIFIRLHIAENPVYRK